MISEFYINGLFEERNVRIPFNSNYKIIVAENGCGKTMVLNSLYALLSGNISKLRKVSFSKIGIIFNDGIEISFDKSEFETDLEFIKKNPVFRDLELEFGKEFTLELIDDVKRYSSKHINKSSLFKQACNVLEIPTNVLSNMLKGIRTDKQVNFKTQDKLDNIKKKFPLEALYLPTYRRIEENIEELGNIFVYESFKHSSINFGMSDVEKRIDIIISVILSSSVEWFSKINGQMLSQLVDGFDVTDEMRESISNPKAVEIVLERIGKNISEAQKQQMLALVNNDENLKENEPFVYFVANLLKVYEQQQENNAIKLFASVSNKYLGDKEIIYDESNVTVKIIRKKSGKILDIECLSSGEKQIISLFSLLYLQKKDDLAIFFDEPELSLSIEWQQTLLPDIVKSGRCKFLFSTTHSPFIFENDLQKDTVDLSEYIEEL